MYRFAFIALTLLASPVISHAEEEAEPYYCRCQDVEDTAAWWAKERFAGIARPYTPERVVSLRETLRQEYPSNAMSKKAWRLFKGLQKKGEYSHTFGALDPVQVVEMAPYLSTVYVSGWQCSSTASTSYEPGPDFADYPMDTVPAKVQQLFEAQRFHDRKQNEARSHLSKEEKIANPPIDYLRPIIADADTGHGGLTAVMKLTKMFIQRGASGIHIEDQKPGTKKCGHMSGKVLVSTQEHCDRLIASRLQADIMGSELIIVARTDAEAATLLDTNIDPRDHAFILGSTTPGMIPLSDLIRLATETYERRIHPEQALDLLRKLGSEYPALAEKVQEIWKIQDSIADTVKQNQFTQSLEDEEHIALNSLCDAWNKEAHLLTYDAAVKRAEEREESLYWNWETPRTFEGYYQIQGGVEMCIARALAFAPYADMIWMETAKPSLKEAKQFSEGVKAVYPDKLLAYNLSPSFNWDKFGMSDNQLMAYQDELGKMGYVWQFITLAGFHGDALFAKGFAEDFAKRKMLAYVEGVQREERAQKVEALTHQKWSGVDLLGSQQDAATSGRMSTGAGGAASTEHQFSKK